MKNWLSYTSRFQTIFFSYWLICLIHFWNEMPQLKIDLLSFWAEQVIFQIRIDNLKKTKKIVLQYFSKSLPFLFPGSLMACHVCFLQSKNAQKKFKSALHIYIFVNKFVRRNYFSGCYLYSCKTFFISDQFCYC